MKRLYHAKLLSADCTRFSDGELWIGEDGVIAFCGVPTESKLAAARFTETRDLGGDYVIPGFKNAHTHSAMVFLRSRAENTQLWPWLSTQIFPREDKLTDEDIYWFTRLAILEYLQNGVTAAFDMYFHANAFYDACIDSGFRAALCGSATADDKESVAKLAALYETYSGKHPRFAVQLGFHAEYTANPDLLKELSKLAEYHKTGVFMHSSETQNEVNECLSRHGKTPTELFSDLGLYRYGGGAFHGVYLSDHDLDLIHAAGVTLVTCPCSNLKLASGIARVSEWAKRSIPFAIGTDGAASNNALDMFRETHLCTVLQKVRTMDPAALKASDALRAAVSVGARTMGFPDCVSLDAGNQADFMILDSRAPNLNPPISPVETLVYAASPRNVKETVIAGRTLYRDGEFFVGENPETIRAQAAARAERIESEL